MKYTCLGYSEENKQIMFIFENPFGGENTERGVIPVLDDDGTINKELTDARVEEVARGVENKMKLKAKEIKPAKVKSSGYGIYKPVKTEEGDAEVVEKPTKKVTKKSK